MVYLLDTNLIIDYLREFEPAVKYLNRLLDTQDKKVISIISMTELYAGKSSLNPAVCQAINKILANIDKILIDETIAVKAGELRRDLGVDIVDALIAATAILNDCILVTRNVKHFKNVPNLQLEGAESA